MSEATVCNEPGDRPLAADDRPGGKPRLLFLQWDHSPNAGASRFLVDHMRQHVKTLQTHFEVFTVNEDCDYAEVCDRYEPDLALFESGYRSHGSRRIEIANLAANPDVPKAGLHNGDPWCDRRSGFISDMERWGIDTFFSISTRMPDYSAELGETLYVWPNAIDPDVFHDHGLEKVIPITMVGKVNDLYPWRQRVFSEIADHFPCLVGPQIAYESPLATLALSGTAYARALNASRASPTCGTMGAEFVRKHVEIPAARCCLLTERTPVVEAAGFADLENCVFLEGGDVLDRLEALFADQNRLAAITDAGFRLAHERHTLRHRPQIFQWFTLSRTLRAGERIVQDGPFEDLRVATAGHPRDARPVTRAADRALLAEGDAHLWEGDVATARAAYERALALVSYLPEARLRLAICALRSGDADAALARLTPLVALTFDYGATDPDPVEWGFFLFALACSGRLDQARALAGRYPRSRHPVLARVARTLARLDGASRADPPTPPGPARATVHVLPPIREERWDGWCDAVLAACGAPAARTRRRTVGRSASERLLGTLDSLLGRLALDGIRPAAPPMLAFRYPRHLLAALDRAALGGRLRRALAASRTASTAPRAPAGRQPPRPEAAKGSGAATRGGFTRGAEAPR